MAPQQAHQCLGNHPDLCFRGKMEIKLSHSHHYLEQQNTKRGNNQQRYKRMQTLIHFEVNTSVSQH